MLLNVCMYADKSALRDDEEWYFFSAPNRKYANSARVERTTNAGYWKVTGKDRPILDSCRKEVIGVKKHLVFYTGRGSDGVKTSWVIHEYHSNKASAYQAYIYFIYVFFFSPYIIAHFSQKACS